MENEKLTPMERQYLALKEEHKDKVLFFRLGDFYEMFNEDAIEVSKILNLTLTHRGSMPMCGIPYHAAKNYLKRLLDYGKKIAISEQMENDENTKGPMKRVVTQVYTPATVVDEEFLSSLESSFVLSLYIEKKNIYLSWADITTGSFFVRTLIKDYQLLDSILLQIRPKEIVTLDDIYYTDKELKCLLEREDTIVSCLPKWNFSIKEGKKETEKQFSSSILSFCNISEKDPILCSIGALLGYLEYNAKTKLPQLRTITVVTDENTLFLNSASIKNLEILNNLNDNSVKGTLFNSINRTITPSGARFLKEQLVHPLCDLDKIRERQNWVEYFYSNLSLLNDVKDFLKHTSDVERLSVKALMKKSTPRDLLGLAESSLALLDLLEINSNLYSICGEINEEEKESIISFSNRVLSAINPECTNINNDGTIILSGYDTILDEKRELMNGGSSIVNDYLNKVREETNISTLRLGENRILGLYLEVSKGQLDKVPSYFIRRQTLVNGERFTTNELSEIYSELSNSKEEAAYREREVFKGFVAEAASLYNTFLVISKAITLLDFYTSLSDVALEKNYIRPIIKEEGDLIITDGRHPVVEDYVTNYVSNSFSTVKSRFSLITGPNMAGKSTYLREIALIVLLSHIGSFVPAKEAEIPICDKIFCRVGAGDNLSKGESTFLLEMSETSQILRSLTPKSLVIMDEIGRGTSTQDGMSLAYAIMQYLIKSMSITLFATHYHELTLFNTEGMQLLHMLVEENKNDVIFLRKATEGVATSSYGLHVAKLAGLPREVIKDARVFQSKHFADYTSFNNDQGNLFMEDISTEEENEIITKLRDFDLDSSSPKEALNFLYDIKEKLKEE